MQENALLVPHLEPKQLEKVGIYFPSLPNIYSYWTDPMEHLGPTKDSISEIKQALNRANNPGVPGDLTAYLHCYVCGKDTDTWQEMEEHRKQCNKITIFVKFIITDDSYNSRKLKRLTSRN